MSNVTDTPVANPMTQTSSAASSSRTAGRIRKDPNGPSNVESISQLKANPEWGERSFQCLVSLCSENQVAFSEDFEIFTRGFSAELRSAILQESRGLAISYFSLFGKSTGIFILTLDGNRRIRPFIQRKSCRVFRAYFDRNIFVTSNQDIFGEHDSLESALAIPTKKMLRGLELRGGDTFYASQRITEFSIGTGSLGKTERVHCFIGIHENLNR